MPLRLYKCLTCGSLKETFKADPICCETKMEKQLVAPETKFMEPRGSEAKEKGRSVLKNQDKILRERTRSWSRDNEGHDLIQKNPMEDAVKNQWINSDGTPRKKIDDI